MLFCRFVRKMLDVKLVSEAKRLGTCAVGYSRGSHKIRSHALDRRNCQLAINYADADFFVWNKTVTALLSYFQRRIPVEKCSLVATQLWMIVPYSEPLPNVPTTPQNALKPGCYSVGLLFKHTTLIMMLILCIQDTFHTFLFFYVVSFLHGVCSALFIFHINTQHDLVLMGRNVPKLKRNTLVKASF